MADGVFLVSLQVDCFSRCVSDCVCLGDDGLGCWGRSLRFVESDVGCVGRGQMPGVSGWRARFKFLLSCVWVDVFGMACLGRRVWVVCWVGAF
eukprot:1394662-Amorphochlora_amoeboformis.AAC.2